MEIDDQSALPAEVTVVISAYLGVLDEKLPARINGLYLIGSVALDDYRGGQSDIDFVAVSDTALISAEITQLRQVHKEMQRIAPRLKLDGLYVTWSDLQTQPKGLPVPGCRDGWFELNDVFKANPVTWYMMHRYCIPMRGPAKPVVRHDAELLRRWCLGNLQSYWADWVHSARTHWIKRVYSLSRKARIWGVLGVTRLHATIRTEEIFSKTAVGDYALAAFPHRWSSVIQEALESRSGIITTPAYDVIARRKEMLAFMEYVISDAMV